MVIFFHFLDIQVFVGSVKVLERFLWGSWKVPEKSWIFFSKWVGTLSFDDNVLFTFTYLLKVVKLSRSELSLSSGSGLRSLEDVLPLSSRYLISSTSGSLGTSQPKPEMATLAADNRALNDAVDQQRYKLKVCSSSISCVLETVYFK